MDAEEKINFKEESQAMTQWIVSLAISVVCCSVLFLIFAGYIMDLHKSMTDAKVKIEVLDERITRLTTEFDMMRRPTPIININGNATTPAGEAAPTTVNVVDPAAAPASVPPVEVPAVPKAEEKVAPVVPPVPAVKP